MYQIFLEKILSLAVKYWLVETYQEEKCLDIQRAELRCEIAIAAFDEKITFCQAKKLLNKFTF